MSQPLDIKSLSDEMRLNDVQWDTDGETLVWLERRDGRNRLVSQNRYSAPKDITPSSHSVGGQVGYGGGAFHVHDGLVIFGSKGRLWCVTVDGRDMCPITPNFGGYASPVLSSDNQWVAFVHQYEGRDGIAVIDSDGKEFPRKLAYNHDFVMQPSWHPDGSYLTYVGWNHPNMPWNSSDLCLIEVAYDTQGFPYAKNETTLICDPDTSIFQPTFDPTGQYLAYASDSTGFWHIYLYDMKTSEHTQLTQGEMEHAIPGWIQGMRTFSWALDGQALYIIRHKNAFYELIQVDIETGNVTQIEQFSDYTHIEQITTPVKSAKPTVIASSTNIPTRIISLQNDELQIVRRATREHIPSSGLSRAQSLSWQSGDSVAHGLFYEPVTPRFSNPPPLILMAHSGPSSQASADYDPKVQFFTTRGFAVLQVNYRGSTGFGKAYLNAMQGQWGVVDVEDCVSGVQYLISENKVDAEKCVIMGSSAGGLTVLLTLIHHPHIFKAGICAYGVADHFALSFDTHKFEKHYNDWLLGKLPEASQIYRNRSPIFHADKIQDAMLVFHGARDNVVSQSQSDAIVAQLRRNGVTHEYHVFEDEGHSFRQPHNLAEYYKLIEHFLLVNMIYQ